MHATQVQYFHHPHSFLLYLCSISYSSIVPHSSILSISTLTHSSILFLFYLIPFILSHSSILSISSLFYLIPLFYISIIPLFYRIPLFCISSLCSISFLYSISRPSNLSHSSIPASLTTSSTYITTHAFHEKAYLLGGMMGEMNIYNNKQYFDPSPSHFSFFPRSLSIYFLYIRITTLIPALLWSNMFILALSQSKQPGDA